MRAALLVLAAIAGCGTTPIAPPGPDAASSCSAAADCDDGTFCNGPEACAPGTIGADARGCVRGDRPCPDTQTCIEERDECITDCALEPDADGDGEPSVECRGDDCDDHDPLSHPGATEICDEAGRDEDCDPTTFGERDADGDGQVDAACCNADGASMRCGADCNDLRRDVSPALLEVCDELDNDCDAATDEGLLQMVYEDRDFDLHGDASRPAMACPGLPGFSTLSDDCDDADPARHGAQGELCDRVDNNCNGEIDEAPVAVAWYPDDDGDGFGTGLDSSRIVISCEPQPARSLRASDCDDGDADVHPGAGERCNGVDDDCDGHADAIVMGDGEDDDADGYGDRRCGGNDCDDLRASVHPGASEICDMLDNDCDGMGDAGRLDATWYVDLDRDGFGDPDDASPVVQCDPVIGHAVNGNDCDDSAAAVHPGALDRCGGGDEDCDGRSDEGATRTAFFPDADRDGWGSGDRAAISFSCTPPPGATDRTGDCDDEDPDRFPTATERCDTIDEDCDGRVDEAAAQRWYPDVDRDTHGAVGSVAIEACMPPGPAYAAIADDCADEDASRFPGAREACDGIDQDCDGTVDDGAASDCAVASGTGVCTPSGCAIGSCMPSFADCDAVTANGCEVDTRTSAGHCGACGMRCGLGDTCGRTTPGICDASPIVQLAGGYRTFFALRATGGYVAWGQGSSGELGGGAASPTGRPIAGTAADLVQIDAGQAFACGRTRAGRVLCWGSDDVGQLGDGVSGGSRIGPAPVIGISDAVDVATGVNHACAVLRDGTMRCWGSGSSGRLGNGSATDSATPVVVSGMADAVDAECGNGFCCARRTPAGGGSRVQCWGRGETSQLGNGGTAPSLAPTDVTGLPADVVAFASGLADAMCVIDASGRAWCWGSGYDLGTGGAHIGAPVTPTGLDSGVVQIAFSGSETDQGACARVRSASALRLTCWGTNNVGQLGFGDVSARDLPGQFLPLAMEDIQQVVRIDATTCVLRSDGRVYCFGWDAEGELGDDACTMPRTTPRAIDLPVCGIP